MSNSRISEIVRTLVGRLPQLPFQRVKILKFPGKSDSNLIFAGSFLVSGREQLPLLPELRMSIPEQNLNNVSAKQSQPEHGLRGHFSTQEACLGPLKARLHFAGLVFTRRCHFGSLATRNPRKLWLKSMIGSLFASTTTDAGASIAKALCAPLQV